MSFKKILLLFLFFQVHSIWTMPRVELQHFLDPDTKDYKRKVTIPKDFSGKLYLSGLNLGTLGSRFIKVRFRFGREMENITINSNDIRLTFLKEKGIVQFLELDLKTQPFRKLRLLYDLYDYNDYWKGGVHGAETGEPTTNPLDQGLYCRGLKIQHDTTFKATGDNTSCDQAGEKCFYAYAKIRDKGLVDITNSLRPKLISPSKSQIDFSGDGLNFESIENRLEKCLPDNNNFSNFSNLLQLNTISSSSFNIGVNILHMRRNSGATTGEEEVLSLSQRGDYDIVKTYEYRGPYQAIETDQWEISRGAIFSLVGSNQEGTGIFQNSYNNSVSYGYKSFLFPRSGKINLRQGVEHFSSSLPFDIRNIIGSSFSGGETNYVDGCNLRAPSYNENAEHIGSCNVSATIEIFYEEDGREISLAESKGVKLQLVRGSLNTSFNSCIDSNQCGQDQCCFNNRCWSSDIVGQCIDREKAYKNNKSAIESVCISDNQCASLCCKNNRCASHVISQGENGEESREYSCNKAAGTSCISSKFCQTGYHCRNGRCAKAPEQDTVTNP